MSHHKAEILRRSLVFSRLEDDNLAELACLAVRRSLGAGQFVFWEGDAPEWFYMVVSGRVKVHKQSSLGREFIIAFFDPGEMFGEVAVFESKPYPASAQAVIETEVLGIKREAFISFLAGRPEVALAIINVLGGRLRDAQGRLSVTTGERVEQRIAGTLLMLSSKVGPTLPFTRHEIADMTGTTTETVIRVMGRLRDRGIIGSTRGKTTIINEDRLRLLSEGPSQP